MRLLIDTNIVLEIILDQEKSEEARALFSNSDTHEFFMSNFSIHSIGIFLFRRNQRNDFKKFINDMLINIGVKIKSLSLDDMGSAISAADSFNLDFDDAYQYATAEKFDLTLVSFDHDFDRTERGRKAPAEIIKEG